MDNLPSSAPAPDFDPHPAPLPAASVGAGPTTRRSAIFSGSALLVVAALVAVGGVTFAVGRLTAPVAAVAAARGNGGAAFGNGARPSGAPGFGRQGGLGGAFAGGSGGLSIRGTVTSVTADTLTITVASGTTVQIPLEASTTYHSQVAGSKTDVQSGKQVIVQLNGLGGGGGAAGPTASPNIGASSRIGPAQDVTVVSP